MPHRKAPARDWSNDRLARLGGFIASALGLGFMFIWSIALTVGSVVVAVWIFWLIFLR